MKEYSTKYNWRSTGGLPPPGGNMGCNTGTWATTTQTLYLDELDNQSVDYTPYVKMMRAGDRIKVAHPTDLNSWALWELETLPVDYTSYFTFPGHWKEVHGSVVTNTIYNVTLYTEVTPRRTIVQLTSCAGLTGSNSFWYAIYCTCSDQTIWTMGDDHVWRQLPSLPQPDAPT